MKYKNDRSHYNYRLFHILVSIKNFLTLSIIFIFKLFKNYSLFIQRIKGSMRSLKTHH
jgi:hypothetical protein